MPFDNDGHGLNRQDFIVLNSMLDAALDKISNDAREKMLDDVLDRMLVDAPEKDKKQLLLAKHTQLLNSVNKSIAVLQKIQTSKTEVDENDLTECFPKPVLRHSDRADLPPGSVPIVHRCSSEENSASASCFQEWIKRKSTHEDYGVQTESDGEDNNKTKKKSNCTIM